jgi:hypothetical protein
MINQTDSMQDIVKELTAAKDSAEKAAIIAEFILSELPESVAQMVRGCAILHWFDQPFIEAMRKARLIDAMSKPNPKAYLVFGNEDIYEQIIALPFVEKLPWGFALQDLTREGLLKRYAARQPGLLTSAARLAAPIYEARHNDKADAEALFCYIIEGNKVASKNLMRRLTRQARERGDAQYVNNLLEMVNEAWQIPSVEPFRLTEAIPTWRELLGKVIADPQERQRIADALSVNPITLTRWATNKSNPRQDNLRPLFEALPQHRQFLTELIAQEFPQFINETLTQESIASTIPPGFYAQILNVYTTSPARLRVSTTRLLILQQIIAHLDPHQEGLLAFIAQCVPPRAGNKVRSMHMTYGRSTPAWNSFIKNRILFFGAESPMGQALSTAQPIIINTPEIQLFPIQGSPFERSSLSYPLLRDDRVAGCLTVASTHPHYFTQERLEVLQEYAHLLVLAFEPSEFYDLQNIELGIMPNPESQHIDLKDFQTSVTQHLIWASQRYQVLSRSQAELLVSQELEEKFLHLAD